MSYVQFHERGSVASWKQCSSVAKWHFISLVPGLNGFVALGELLNRSQTPLQRSLIIYLPKQAGDEYKVISYLECSFNRDRPILGA